MATMSRHPATYTTHHKTLPITMPSKQPAYNYPVSRVAMSPPELSDTSSYGSRTSAGSYSARSSDYGSNCSSRDYDSHSSHPGGVDIMEVLTEKMDGMYSPIRMDRSLADQAKMSGELNAKQRELQDLQARARRRLKTARVNFAEGLDAQREAREDVDYTTKKMSAMKSKAEKKHPEHYAKASRSRHI